MKRILMLLLILVLSTTSFADEDGVKKYRNYTPEQIKELPNKIRSNTLPIMYIMAAKKGLSEGAELVFGMELNSLMYSGLHNYKAAIKSFQTDLGDKPTGELTVWQIHKLGQRTEMQKLSQILFPDQFSSVKTDDYASVEGTMIILDEKTAYPINHVKIKCYKNRNYCEFNQLDLAVPNESSWSQIYSVMESGTEYYDITRWSKNSIDCVPRETVGGCRTTSVNLNFKTKEFFYITRNAGGDCEFMGATIPKLKKPRISQIVDGKKIIQKEFNAIAKAAFNVLSSDFRTKIEKLLSEESKTKE